MNTYETKIDRVIGEELYTMANEFISCIQRTECVDIDDLLPCLVKDDYREPVEDAIRNGTAAMLFDLCPSHGWDLTTTDGRVIDREDDAEREVLMLDRKAIIADIAADDAWREVAEYVDIEPHTVEALQFWLVSDWLAEHLEETGALVARDVMGFNVWGRTECGSGLDTDSDLKAVVADMERRLHEALHGPALDQDAAHYGTAE